jgi:hypothetical protein
VKRVDQSEQEAPHGDQVHRASLFHENLELSRGRREANRSAAMRELEQLRRSGFDLSSLEPFVSACVVALFIDVNPACVVRDAAAGLLPAYPLRANGQRTHWRFLLSEVQASMLARRPKETTSNVRTQATKERKTASRRQRLQ